LAQFRGTVISWNSAETPTTRVVAYPPPALVENASITPALKNLSEWTITTMADETVITLYNHGGEWKLASTRGIDVSGHHWMDSGITFREALDECLSGSTTFSYDNLDPEWCYTIGFHHHKMHPFAVDPQHARLLQAAKTAGVLAPVALTCAKETREEFEAVAARVGIPADSPAVLADLGHNRLKSWMVLNNKHALNNYVQAAHRGVPGPVHYGYILRRIGDGEGPANISLPSSLFQLIKKSVYSFPQGIELNADRRRQYIILRACLSPEMKYDFLRLFPQWTPEYKTFETYLGQVASVIVSELSRRQLGSAEWSQEGIDDQTLGLAKVFEADAIKLDVNPLDSLATSIITDLITSPDNLDVLMAHLV
jgi:hypothetical protein